MYPIKIEEIYSEIDIHNYEQNQCLEEAIGKRMSKMEKEIIDQILLNHDCKIYEDLSWMLKK